MIAHMRGETSRYIANGGSSESDGDGGLGASVSSRSRSTLVDSSPPSERRNAVEMTTAGRVRVS